MTADRKAQLLENLKKGRETSKINRRKNKLAKEIKKRENTDARDQLIKDDMLKNVEHDDMKKELVRLRKELGERATLTETPTEKPKEKPKPEPQTVDPTEDANDLQSKPNRVVPLRDRNINKPIQQPTDDLKNVSMFRTDTFY